MLGGDAQCRYVDRQGRAQVHARDQQRERGRAGIDSRADDNADGGSEQRILRDVDLSSAERLSIFLS